MLQLISFTDHLWRVFENKLFIIIITPIYLTVK